MAVLDGLGSYYEFKLLTLTDGKCAQDWYYLTPILEKDLPIAIKQRHKKKVEKVIPLSDKRLLVFFRDGSMKRIALAANDRRFAPVLNNDKIFNDVKVETGGYCICWGENLCINYDKLYTIKEAS